MECNERSKSYVAGSVAPGNNWFQFPSATSFADPLLGTAEMSTIMRFGRAGFTEVDGVESQRSARSAFLGSIHRNISCGFTACPAFEVGT